MDILLLILRLLLVVALYAFLGAVLLTLWRDLRQATAHRETTRPGGRLVVLHTEEDDETLAVGATFPLQLVTSIGRSPSNTIPITAALRWMRYILSSPPKMRSTHRARVAINRFNAKTVMTQESPVNTPAPIGTMSV